VALRAALAYDERLAARIRQVLEDRSDVTERHMFGGVAFMVRGHMCLGILKDDLMIRVGKDAYEETLRRPHARRMAFTGRPMTGYVFVAPAGLRTTTALRSWILQAVRHADSLPAKKGPATPKRRSGVPAARKKRSR